MASVEGLGNHPSTQHGDLTCELAIQGPNKVSPFKGAFSSLRKWMRQIHMDHLRRGMDPGIGATSAHDHR